VLCIERDEAVLLPRDTDPFDGAGVETSEGLMDSRADGLDPGRRVLLAGACGEALDEPIAHSAAADDRASLRVIDEGLRPLSPYIHSEVETHASTP
jgi:hypothetical protein